MCVIVIIGVSFNSICFLSMRRTSQLSVYNSLNIPLVSDPKWWGKLGLSVEEKEKSKRGWKRTPGVVIRSPLAGNEGVVPGHPLTLWGFYNLICGSRELP